MRERVDVPIALDEMREGTPPRLLACVKAGACDIFVVKLMKIGWHRLGALKVNAIAEAAGIPVTMGNMGESSLGLAAHLHCQLALANVDSLGRRPAVASGGPFARSRERAHRRRCATASRRC